MALIDDTRMHAAMERVFMTVDTGGMAVQDIKNLAKDKAREYCPDPMLLSWHSAKSGQYWPRYACGAAKGDPWVVWAASRGCNLVVDVNNGEYRFYFLKI